MRLKEKQINEFNVLLSKSKYYIHDLHGVSITRFNIINKNKDKLKRLKIRSDITGGKCKLVVFPSSIKKEYKIYHVIKHILKQTSYNNHINYDTLKIERAFPLYYYHVLFDFHNWVKSSNDMDLL